MGPLLRFWEPQHEEAYLRQKVRGLQGWPRCRTKPAPPAARSGHLAHCSHSARSVPPQMACRLYLVRHWAPRSDPMLAMLLLALHATLLLRLLLGGGLEHCPLPLLGAYLSWHALRMADAWVRCCDC